MSNSIFIIVAAVYSIVMLIIGVYFSRRQKSVLTYFLGGRNIPAWIIAFTFTASWFGPTAAVVATGRAFHGGLSAIWVIAGPTWIAIALITALFSRKMRAVSASSNIYTLADVFRLRYGRVSAFLMFLCVLGYLWGLTAACFLGMAKALNALVGMNWYLGLIIAAVIAIIYTTLGGYESVLFTDVVQALLLGGGMVAFAFISLHRAGGFEGVRQIAAQQTGYLNVFHDFGNYLPIIIAFGLGWVASQEIFQRFASAKDEKHARRGGWWALVVNVPLFIVPVLAGIGAAVWLPGLVEKAGAAIPEAEKITFWATTNVLGGFGVFLFVAILAAIMSSADTFINAAGMTVTRDIYGQYFHKGGDLSDKRMVTVSRIGTLIICLLALLIALAFTSILDALFLGSDILVCGMLVPLVGAFWWKRATKVGATLSTAVGFGFVIIDFILHKAGVNVPYPGYPKSLYVGFGLSVVLFIVGSLLSKPEEDSKVMPFFPKLG
jgi:SSS family solute:Na+ symporter